MKKINNEKVKRQTRMNRNFSESFKKEKVWEIDNNLIKVSEICTLYNVSRSAVYKWIYQYSLNHKRQVKQVVEAMSDTKKIIELQNKIKELEQLVGQQQMKLQVNDKMIEIAEDHYGIDLKKNSDLKPQSTSSKQKKKGSSQ